MNQASRMDQQAFRQKMYVPGFKEALNYQYYDYLSYAAAGQSALRFFASPQGQSGRTYQDTNMELAGQFEAGTTFHIYGFESRILPGSNASSWASSPIAASGTALAAPTWTNDVQAWEQNGVFEFAIGQKNYARVSPMGRIPSHQGLGIAAADALATTVTATTDQITVDYARIVGQPYMLNKPIIVEANQTFQCTVTWPNGVVAMPSGKVAKVGIIMHGILFRN